MIGEFRKTTRSTWEDRMRIGLIADARIYVAARDRMYRVRVYSDRLAISRTGEDAYTDVHEPMSWEELQHVKNYVWGDHVQALELYPPEDAVVNLRNTRHLWLSTPTRPHHPEFYR